MAMAGCAILLHQTHSNNPNVNSNVILNVT
jgi:hypothetical protein